MRISIALLSFLLSSMPAWSGSITNAELLTKCKEKSESSLHFCYGFIIGTANGAQFYRNIVDVNDEYIDICFPDNISNKEIVDDYIEWAESHSDLASGPAFIGVSTSFSRKYSCPSNEEAPSRDLFK